MNDVICALPPKNKEKWVIDPEKTLVFVPDFPKRSASTALMLWLSQRFKNIQPFNKPDVCCMRNSLIRDVVKRTRYEWYCMFDNDMHPTATTDVLFEPQADVVCVQCNHLCGGAWAYPTDFHCNGFRFNRAVADKIALPWFVKSYSDDGCDQTGCSCQHFRSKVLQAGFTIQRAGWMQHGLTGVVS